MPEKRVVYSPGSLIPRTAEIREEPDDEPAFAFAYDVDENGRARKHSDVVTTENGDEDDNDRDGDEDGSRKRGMFSMGVRDDSSSDLDELGRETDHDKEMDDMMSRMRGQITGDRTNTGFKRPEQTDDMVGSGPELYSTTARPLSRKYTTMNGGGDTTGAKNSTGSMGEKAQDVNTTLEHVSHINVITKANAVRQTGIICTIGPVSRSVAVLKTMIQKGMNIARLNFSHGTHEYHRETIANIREALASDKLSPQQKTVAIALDTKGPEIRTGLLEGGASAEIYIKIGDKVRVTTDPEFRDSSNLANLYVDYENITKVLAIGSRVYVDDGLISLVVDDIEPKALLCTAENEGLLGSKKGVNLPGSKVDLPAVSVKDVDDLRFGLEQKVDMIFASFIRNKEGIQTIRKIIGDRGREIMIIAKIENEEGLLNMNEIVAEADGVMVARGDLGIEIPTEKVFLAQKKMIAKCNLAGKPVICATQMLESMIDKPRPTRAEGSDVANAVNDGADCVMLSGETAKGRYPVQALSIMSQICKEAESAYYHNKFIDEIIRLTPKPLDAAEAISMAAVTTSINTHASAIITITTTGRTPKLISRYRPNCPIIAVCGREFMAKQLHLWRGVFPLMYQNPIRHDWTADVQAQLKFGIETGLDRGILQKGDFAILITGWKEGEGDFTNTMRIITI